MQMRYDLLICYGAIGMLLLLALILPIPTTLQMILLTPIIIYLGCHQAAQTTKETKYETNSDALAKKHSADLFLFPLIATICLILLVIIFKILPFALLSYFFTTTTLCLATWLFAQRVNIILIGLSTEEQEQKIRGHKCNIPLEHINKAIRPYISQLDAAKGPFAAISSALASIGSLFQTVKCFIIEKVDGKDAADQAKRDADAGDSGLCSICPFSALSALPPSPTAQGTTVNQSANQNDWLPDLITFDGVAAFSFAISVFMAFLFLITRFSLFHNFFAIAFALHVIELVNLGSFKNALFVLGGVIVYDFIWFFELVSSSGTAVTGESVVAQVPHQIPLAALGIYFPHSTTPVMLGIANVILPALLIALFLRFDMFLVKPFQHRDAKASPLNLVINHLGSLSYITIATDYFNLALIGYLLGLVLNAMLSSLRQPSLVYIIPSILITTVAPSFVLWQDEFKQLTAFVDEPEERDSPASSRLSVSALSPQLASPKTE